MTQAEFNREIITILRTLCDNTSNIQVKQQQMQEARAKIMQLETLLPVGQTNG